MTAAPPKSKTHTSQDKLATALSVMARSATLSEEAGRQRARAGTIAAYRGNIRRGKFPDPFAILAGYDAAQTTAENRRHWAQADALSAAAAGSGGVRALLRRRARYEVANNSLARGIVLTLANDLVGTGPRLQLQTDDSALNKRIEKEFQLWAGEIGLAGKLRTMRAAKAQDGEAFGVMATNPRLAGLIQLDLQLVEADRVATPTYGLLAAADERRAVDGIVFDEFGNPVEYHVLKHHPGAMDASWRAMTGSAADQYDPVAAANVTHWFRADRPEQKRGLPDLMPALPLFAILRRYIKATLLSAETAAALSILFSTDAPAEGEAAAVEPWMELAIEPNTGIFLPEGWKAEQMRAEQPASTMPEFRHEIVNEIARCLNMPLNIAIGNSGGYNYASGSLDYQAYDRTLSVERDGLARCVLDPLFGAFIAEVVRAPLGLFGEVERIHWPRTWIWPGRGHADPVKNARAAEILLRAGLTTEAAIYGGDGRDWEEEQDQRQREAEGRAERGLPALLQKQA